MVNFFRSSSLFLSAYGIAWKITLPFLKIVARLDLVCKKLLRRGFLPRRWYVPERLGLVPPMTSFTTPFTLEAEAFQQNSLYPQNTLWMHAASLGEAKGLWAVIDTLVQGDQGQGSGGWWQGSEGRGQRKSGREFSATQLRIVVTASTAAGRDFLEQSLAELKAVNNVGQADIFVAIAPLDHPSVVQSFIKAWQVRTLILYEAEFWPNFILVSARFGLPVFLVSARMSNRAYSLYCRFPKTCDRILTAFSWIQTQTEVDRFRFQKLGATSLSTGIDFKAAYFLSAHTNQAKPHFQKAKTTSGRGRLALVSIHFAEMQLFAEELRFLFATFDLVIIPRNLQELPRFERLLKPFWRRQELGLYSAHPTARNVLVNSMGVIPSLLPHCDLAFVGGSLIPVGCHNLWEPLLAGLKIYFGPYYGNQAGLAEILLQRGIAEQITDITQVRAWTLPGPAVAEKCQRLIAETQASLEHAQEECRARIFATLQGMSGKSLASAFSRGNQP